MTNLDSKYKYKIFDFLEYLKKNQPDKHRKLMVKIPEYCNVSRMTFYRWIKIPLVPVNPAKEQDIPAKCLDIIAESLKRTGIDIDADGLKNYKVEIPENF